MFVYCLNPSVFWGAMQIPNSQSAQEKKQITNPHQKKRICIAPQNTERIINHSMCFTALSSKNNPSVFWGAIQIPNCQSGPKRKKRVCIASQNTEGIKQNCSCFFYYLKSSAFRGAMQIPKPPSTQKKKESASLPKTLKELNSICRCCLNPAVFWGAMQISNSQSAPKKKTKGPASPPETLKELNSIFVYGLNSSVFWGVMQISNSQSAPPQKKVVQPLPKTLKDSSSEQKNKKICF